MTEDTTPERIPFEEHPLYPLYKAGRQQWNLFMKEYLNEDKITEISMRNPTMKDDFEAKSTLTAQQKDIFHLYMDSAPNKQERGLRELFYHLDFKNYIFNENVEFTNYLFPNAISFTNAKFLFMADFQRAEFSDWAGFQSAQFSGTAYFQSVQFLDKTNFENAQFSGWAGFHRTQFSDWTNFQSAQFSQKAFFQSTQFSGQADFKSAKFSFPADFQSAQFSKLADFKSAQFSDVADFQSAEFSKQANFQHTQFSKQANFQHTQFLSVADFQSARFSDLADFQSAKFSSRARFNNVEFGSRADFQNAQFSERANFIKATFKRTIDFSNAQFKAKTDFTGTIFKQFVPQFYEATLHQNTIFDNTIWPNSSNIQDEQILSSNQSAYNCLVLEMNKQLRHEQELYFFAKELEIKRHIHWKHWQILSWLLNGLYAFASSYGRSIWRPIRLIFLSLIAIFLVNYYTDNAMIYQFYSLETILRYTFLNLLPGGPLLQQRAVAGLFEVAELQPPPLWLDMVNSFASIAILAGFFLLGLGLRNRFRIR